MASDERHSLDRSGAHLGGSIPVRGAERIAISVPLLAFVDGGIYLNRSHDGRQFVLNVTSMLYSLLGLERNGERFFAAELDPERTRTRHRGP